MKKHLLHITRTAAVAVIAALVFSNLAAAAEPASEPLWTNVQKAGVLRAGAGLAPPDVIRDPQTGEYSGIFVDLLREFADKELGGVKVAFVDTDWDNMIAGLNSNKWDVAMAINRKPQRAMVIHFSQPSRFFEVSLVFNKDNPKIKAISDFPKNFDNENITFAVVGGTAEEQALSARVHKAKILKLPNIGDVRLAVSSRRADVSVADSVTNQLFINVNEGWAVAAMPEPALAKQGIAYGFRRSVPLDDIEAFNIFIEQKTADGSVARLTQKYSAKETGQ
ncbi:substrate-binding periplasmic protein [Pseudomonas sp. NA-150]|uniref:substrate-binding periplasmic protein n=1 Tax=Pseudomonas sp. NA-150 TaxID=3367525 RepID=UPI0037C71AA8